MTLAELGPCLGGALTAARSHHTAIGGNFRHPSLFWSLLETVHMNHFLSSRGPVCLISSKRNGRGCTCWAACGRGGGGRVLWASLGVPGPEGARGGRVTSELLRVAALCLQAWEGLATRASALSHPAPCPTTLVAVLARGFLCVGEAGAMSEGQASCHLTGGLSHHCF